MLVLYLFRMLNNNRIYIVSVNSVPLDWLVIIVTRRNVMGNQYFPSIWMTRDYFCKYAKWIESGRYLCCESKEIVFERLSKILSSCGAK